MRLQLSFYDYEKNDNGIHTTYTNLRELRVVGDRIAVKIFGETGITYHRLNKLGDLELTVREGR